nr:MAG TPA: Tetrahydromethanopterin S-methyltransferase subunit A [Ackermannviridae sp.]
MGIIQFIQEYIPNKNIRYIIVCAILCFIIWILKRDK